MSVSQTDHAADEGEDAPTPFDERILDPNDNVGSREFYLNLIGDPALKSLVHLLTEMTPGERLPSERDLTDRLAISRNTLRDRIGKLEAMGVLTRKERQGTFFAGLEPEKVGSILTLGLLFQQMSLDSLISVRHALERQAAIEACRNANQADLAALSAAVAAMADTDNEQRLLSADLAFHGALFEASSPALLFFATVLRMVLRGTQRGVVHEYTKRGDDPDAMHQIHVRVLAAIEARDAAAASDAIDAHFDWHNSWLEGTQQRHGEA